MPTISNTILNLSHDKFENKLNVAHVNVCSLFPKLSAIRELIANTPINALCLSETWLNNVHSDQMLTVNGFNIIRHDRSRTDRRSSSGGVCIFLSKNLTYKIELKSPSDSALEFLIVQVTTSKNNNVGVVYNPPDNRDLTDLYELWDRYSDSIPDLVLTGDFNVNVCSSVPPTQTFASLFHQNIRSEGFSIINSTPTHFQTRM